jgi:hypothetical protein
MRYDVTNALFKEKSWYFRNALVRANYENPKLNVEKTQLPLEEFFKVLIYGYDIELRNRFLRIGYEHGTQKAEAVGNLHRHDAGINDGVNDGVNKEDDGVNGAKNDLIERYALSEREEKAVMAILRDNRITAKQLADILSVKKRQAERIIASLKRKTPLHRDGADKNGRWVFEEV